jgi:hypothetical protein
MFLILKAKAMSASFCIGPQQSSEHIDYTQVEWTAKAKIIDMGIDTVAGASAASAFKSVLPNPAVTAKTCAAADVVCISAQGVGRGQYLPQLALLAGDGKLKIRIGKTLPLAEAGQAQEINRAGRIEGNCTCGQRDTRE